MLHPKRSSGGHLFPRGKDQDQAPRCRCQASRHHHQELRQDLLGGDLHRAGHQDSHHDSPPARLPSRRRPRHRRIRHQRPVWRAYWSLIPRVLFLAAAAALSACRNQSPQQSYDSIKVEVDRGNFDTALVRVDQILKRPPTSQEWDWRFRILKARILVWQKQSAAALSLLSENPSLELATTEIPEQRRFFQGMAYLTSQNFAEATKAFTEAEGMVARLSPLYKCQLFTAQGALDLDQKRYA